MIDFVSKVEDIKKKVEFLRKVSTLTSHMMNKITKTAIVKFSEEETEEDEEEYVSLGELEDLEIVFSPEIDRVFKLSDSAIEKIKETYESYKTVMDELVDKINVKIESYRNLLSKLEKLERGTESKTKKKKPEEGGKKEDEEDAKSVKEELMEIDKELEALISKSEKLAALLIRTLLYSKRMLKPDYISIALKNKYGDVSPPELSIKMMDSMRKNLNKGVSGVKNNEVIFVAGHTASGLDEDAYASSLLTAMSIAMIYDKPVILYLNTVGTASPNRFTESKIRMNIMTASLLANLVEFTKKEPKLKNLRIVTEGVKFSGERDVIKRFRAFEEGLRNLTAINTGQPALGENERIKLIVSCDTSQSTRLIGIRDLEGYAEELGIEILYFDHHEPSFFLNIFSEKDAEKYIERAFIIPNSISASSDIFTFFNRMYGDIIKKNSKIYEFMKRVATVGHVSDMEHHSERFYLASDIYYMKETGYIDLDKFLSEVSTRLSEVVVPVYDREEGVYNPIPLYKLLEEKYAKSGPSVSITQILTGTFKNFTDEYSETLLKIIMESVLTSTNSPEVASIAANFLRLPKVKLQDGKTIEVKKYDDAIEYLKDFLELYRVLAKKLVFVNTRASKFSSGYDLGTVFLKLFFAPKASSGLTPKAVMFYDSGIDYIKEVVEKIFKKDPETIDALLKYSVYSVDASKPVLLKPIIAYYNGELNSVNLENEEIVAVETVISFLKHAFVNLISGVSTFSQKEIVNLLLSGVSIKVIFPPFPEIETGEKPTRRRKKTSSAMSLFEISLELNEPTYKAYLKVVEKLGGSYDKATRTFNLTVIPPIRDLHLIDKKTLIIGSLYGVGVRGKLSKELITSEFNKLIYKSLDGEGIKYIDVSKEPAVKSEYKVPTQVPALFKAEFDSNIYVLYLYTKIEISGKKVSPEKIKGFLFGDERKRLIEIAEQEILSDVSRRVILQNIGSLPELLTTEYGIKILQDLFHYFEVTKKSAAKYADSEEERKEDDKTYTITFEIPFARYVYSGDKLSTDTEYLMADFIDTVESEFTEEGLEPETEPFELRGMPFIPKTFKSSQVRSSDAINAILRIISRINNAILRLSEKGQGPTGRARISEFLHKATLIRASQVFTGASESNVEELARIIRKYESLVHEKAYSTLFKILEMRGKSAEMKKIQKVTEARKLVIYSILDDASSSLYLFQTEHIYEGIFSDIVNALLDIAPTEKMVITSTLRLDKYGMLREIPFGKTPSQFLFQLIKMGYNLLNVNGTIYKINSLNDLKYFLGKRHIAYACLKKLASIQYYISLLERKFRIEEAKKTVLLVKVNRGSFLGIKEGQLGALKFRSSYALQNAIERHLSKLDIDIEFATISVALLRKISELEPQQVLKLIEEEERKEESKMVVKEPAETEKPTEVEKIEEPSEKTEETSITEEEKIEVEEEEVEEEEKPEEEENEEES